MSANLCLLSWELVPPFTWAHKPALRRIRDGLDGENSVATGLLVYHALMEIGSDNESPCFETTYGFIALRTGLSPKTVQRRVKDLIDLGLVKMEVPKLKAPARYTMILPDKSPSLNDGTSSPHDRTSQKTVTSPRSEEIRKKYPEQRQKQGAPAPASLREEPKPPSLDEVLAFARDNNVPEWHATAYFHRMKGQWIKNGSNYYDDYQPYLIDWKKGVKRSSAKRQDEEIRAMGYGNKSKPTATPHSPDMGDPKPQPTADRKVSQADWAGLKASLDR